MRMDEMIYLRMLPRIQVKPDTKIILKDIVNIIPNNIRKEELLNIPVYQVTKDDKNFVVLDVMAVVSKITSFFPHLEVQVIGPSQTIVEVIYHKKRLSLFSFIGVWLLLFFGAALAIMNFHEDVSMKEVHQKIFYIMTGKTIEKPLIFQIPYSFGLGMGMILFFNHLFKKRLNEEPSPLEVEMFNYQQDLDQYMVVNANKERMKKIVKR